MRRTNASIVRDYVGPWTMIIVEEKRLVLHYSVPYWRGMSPICLSVRALRNPDRRGPGKYFNYSIVWRNAPGDNDESSCRPSICKGVIVLHIHTYTYKRISLRDVRFVWKFYFYQTCTHFFVLYNLHLWLL